MGLFGPFGGKERSAVMTEGWGRGGRVRGGVGRDRSRVRGFVELYGRGTEAVRRAIRPYSEIGRGREIAISKKMVYFSYSGQPTF